MSLKLRAEIILYDAGIDVDNWCDFQRSMSRMFDDGYTERESLNKFFIGILEGHGVGRTILDCLCNGGHDDDWCEEFEDIVVPELIEHIQE